MIRNLSDIPLDIQNSINLDITPEEAIALHLEWGQLRDQSYYISSKDTTYHFCINTWNNIIELNLIKRKGFDSWTIGVFDVPSSLIDNFWKKYKGVFQLTEEIKEWILNNMGSSNDS